MGSDQYRRERAQFAKDIGKLRSDMGTQEDKAPVARTIASQRRVSAQRSSSQSTRDSCLRQADAFPPIPCDKQLPARSIYSETIRHI